MDRSEEAKLGVVKRVASKVHSTEHAVLPGGNIAKLNVYLESYKQKKKRQRWFSDECR